MEVKITSDGVCEGCINYCKRSSSKYDEKPGRPVAHYIYGYCELYDIKCEDLALALIGCERYRKGGRNV